MTQVKSDIPILVERAALMASQQGFEQSCLKEVGQVLQIFSGCKPGARIAEVGSGFGVGTALCTELRTSERNSVLVARRVK